LTRVKQTTKRERILPGLARPEVGKKGLMGSTEIPRRLQRSHLRCFRSTSADTKREKWVPTRRLQATRREAHRDGQITRLHDAAHPPLAMRRDDEGRNRKGLPGLFLRTLDAAVPRTRHTNPHNNRMPQWSQVTRVRSGPIPELNVRLTGHGVPQSCLLFFSNLVLVLVQRGELGTIITVAQGPAARRPAVCDAGGGGGRQSLGGTALRQALFGQFGPSLKRSTRSAFAEAPQQRVCAFTRRRKIPNITTSCFPRRGGKLLALARIGDSTDPGRAPYQYNRIV